MHMSCIHYTCTCILQHNGQLKNESFNSSQDENTRVIRELRDEITRLRENLTQGAGPQGGGTAAAAAVSSVEVGRLEAMIGDLQVAKKETWEEKARLSEMYESERRKNLAKEVRTCMYMYLGIDEVSGIDEISITVKRNCMKF